MIFSMRLFANIFGIADVLNQTENTTNCRDHSNAPAEHAAIIQQSEEERELHLTSKRSYGAYAEGTCVSNSTCLLSSILLTPHFKVPKALKVRIIEHDRDVTGLEDIVSILAQIWFKFSMCYRLTGYEEELSFWKGWNMELLNMRW